MVQLSKKLGVEDFEKGKVAKKEEPMAEETVVKKERKLTKAAAIASELLKGAESINAIADNAGAVLGLEKPQTLRSQVKGVLGHIKAGKIAKWSKYKVIAGTEIKIALK